MNRKTIVTIAAAAILIATSGCSPQSAERIVRAMKEDNNRAAANAYAATYGGAYRHSYTTKYKHNSDGSLKSVTGPYYNSRIHRNRDGSINRIHTERR